MFLIVESLNTNVVKCTLFFLNFDRGVGQIGLSPPPHCNMLYYFYFAQIMLYLVKLSFTYY